MAIKIEMLRTFVAVAECKNLADAAARLGRSTPAVSMMLKQFEEHLGKPLFETDRKNRLSAVGFFVLEQAQGQLRQFDDAVRAIETYAHAGLGSVRVAAVPSVAGTILPCAFKEFSAAHPDVQIELRDMDSASVLRALENERVDIGIATIPDSNREFQRTHLFTDDFGIVCRCDHPLARAKEPLGWKALEGEIFIANELCGTIQAPDFQIYYRQSNIRVHNIISLLAMVKAGLGVTVLPLMAAKLGTTEVAYRPIGGKRGQRHIELLHQSRDRISPATAGLVDQIIVTAQKILNGESHHR